MRVLYFNCNARSNYSGTFTVPSFVLKRILYEKETPDIVVLTEVVPRFEDNDDYREFDSKYSWYSSEYVQGKKNSVIIAVNKDVEYIDSNDTIPGFEKEEEAPDYLNLRVVKNGKKYSIIGFRMLTGGYDYDGERELFDRFIDDKNELVMDGTVTILVGDFNNAKHYGAINKTFDEVESEYWKRDWDAERNRYIGKPQKVAQYNYNLHIIKDLLKSKGLELIEKEEDYSFEYKFNQIHDDHFFVSENAANKASVTFYDSEKPLDHRYFVAMIDED